MIAIAMLLLGFASVVLATLLAWAGGDGWDLSSSAGAVALVAAALLMAFGFLLPERVAIQASSPVDAPSSRPNRRKA